MRDAQRSGNKRLRVITFPADAAAGSNPFPRLWAEVVAAQGVDVEPWSRLRLLLRSYDVLHFHWPHALFHDVGHSPRRALAVAVDLTLLRLSRRRGAAVVWSLHNAHPHDHEDDRLGDMTFRWFFHHVDALLLLSERTRERLSELRLAGKPTYVVKHAVYPLSLPASPRRPGGGATRLLSFGEVRPYRGQLELVEVFARIARPDEELHIVGLDRGDGYCRRLAAAVATTPRVTWNGRRLTDDELAEEIRAADVVVLPYGRVLNSGAALLALTCLRPVVVPRTAEFEELAMDAGPGWVHLMEGDGTTGLREALDDARQQPRAQPPVLRGRTWLDSGQLVVQAFREIVETRSGRRMGVVARRT